MESLQQGIHRADWFALVLACLAGFVGIVAVFTLRRFFTRRRSSPSTINALTFLAFVAVVAIQRYTYTEASTRLVAAAFRHDLAPSALKYLGSPSSEARTRVSAIQDHDAAVLYPIKSAYPS